MNSRGENILKKYLRNILAKGKCALLDGGTGEELWRNGVPQDRKIWSAVAVVEEKYHENLVKVHKNFINSGSQFVTINNFGITPGVGFSLTDMLHYSKIASALALQAKRETNSSVWLCASLPPLVESYRSDLIMPYDKGMSIYRELGQAMLPWTDIFLAETLSSWAEMLMAYDAVRDFGKPIFCSWTLNDQGCLRSGEKVCSAIQKLLDHSEKDQECLAAILFNCCLPEAISIALDEVHQSPSICQQLKKRYICLGAYPNRLEPIAEDWQFGSPEPQPMRLLPPEDFYRLYAHPWIEKFKINLIGGCCGIGPEYIQFVQKKNPHQQEESN
eukprot:Sdes_comp17938_c0_seq1m7197